MSQVKKTKNSRFRRFRYGGFAVLLTILVIAAIVGVNMLVSAAEAKWALKIDASPNSITSFSDTTYEMLDKLDQDVTLHMVFRQSTQAKLRTQLEEILAKYRVRNEHIKVEIIDPYTEPGRINNYKKAANAENASLPEGSLIVTNADETRVKLVSASELYNISTDPQSGQRYISGFVAESKLTQAILFVTSGDTPVVYFLTGHDEMASSYCATLVDALQKENIEVKDIELGKGTQLQPGDTLVVSIPSLDFSQAEFDELKAFLDNGGRMLFAQDSSIDMGKTPNINKLLAYYGISCKDGMVVEDQAQSDYWVGSPQVLVPKLNAEHPITKGAAGSKLILPQPMAIGRTAMPLSGFTYTDLLTTSGAAYIKPSTSDQNVLQRGPMDETGTQALAVAIQHVADATDSSKDTRIVVLGSVYLLADSQFTQLSHNLNFTLSAFDWLVNRQNSISIRSKAVVTNVLGIPSQSILLMLAAVVVILVPGVVLVWGILVFMRRRRL